MNGRPARPNWLPAIAERTLTHVLRIQTRRFLNIQPSSLTRMPGP